MRYVVKRISLFCQSYKRYETIPGCNALRKKKFGFGWFAKITAARACPSCCNRPKSIADVLNASDCVSLITSKPGNALLIKGLRIGWDWIWVHLIYRGRRWHISEITCQIGTFPLSRYHSLKSLNYWNKYRSLNQVWTSQHGHVTHVSIVPVGEPQNRSHNVISVVISIRAWWLGNRGLIPSSRLEKSLLSFM